MTFARLIVCFAFSACVPPSAGPVSPSSDDSPPSCDFHATRLGNSCSCDNGYHGDGVSCTADESSTLDTGPSCDIHASRFGIGCSCDIGYHGTGTFCSADD